MKIDKVENERNDNDEQVEDTNDDKEEDNKNNKEEYNADVEGKKCLVNWQRNHH